MADIDLAAIDPATFEEVERLHKETIRPETVQHTGRGSTIQGARPPPAARSSPPVMDDCSIDRLLTDLGTGAPYAWAAPTGALIRFQAPRSAAGMGPARPAHEGSTYAADSDGACDEAGDGDGGSTYEDGADNAANDDEAGDNEAANDAAVGLKELRETLGNVEVTIGTIDDTTVDVKDRVASIERGMDSVVEKVEAVQEDIALVKEQSLAIHETRDDIKALRAEMRAMHDGIKATRKHVATLIRLLTDPGALGATLGAQPPQEQPVAGAASTATPPAPVASRPADSP